MFLALSGYPWISLDGLIYFWISGSADIYKKQSFTYVCCLTSTGNVQ